MICSQHVSINAGRGSSEVASICQDAPRSVTAWFGRRIQRGIPAYTANGARSRKPSLIRWLVICALLVPVNHPGQLKADSKPEVDEREQARATAVALNYCRASFLRIKRNPTKQVLVEEQEKILNNLNLNGIVDEEVINLYSGVLDEIGQIEIAERERIVMRNKYNEIFAERLSANVFLGATQIVTGQMVGAVKTGVESWWDYRTTSYQRDFDVWKVEKARMTAIVSKSSDFLDAGWKLSRDRNIPDEWLVRDDDIERLEVAAREPNLETRLRVMRRMGRFMECYPPYWYYVGRTQQQLGMMRAAADTYEHLADLGVGHFRKDDMLAAGLANLAALQEVEGDPRAVETAALALKASTSVWQANLMCAGILHRHRRVADAEDAILRNLDVEQELPQSRVALASLYVQTRNMAKLKRFLGDAEVARSLPGPVLLQVAGVMGRDCPSAVRQKLHLSFYGFTDRHFGSRDVVFIVSREWQPQLARINLVVDGKRSIPAYRRAVRGGYELRFRNVGEHKTDDDREGGFETAQLVWQYQDATTMELRMSWTPGRKNLDQGLLTAFADTGFRGAAQRDAFRISHFRVDQRIAAAADSTPAETDTAATSEPSMVRNVSDPKPDSADAEDSDELEPGQSNTEANTAASDHVVGNPPDDEPRPDPHTNPPSVPMPHVARPVTLLPLEPID